MRAGSHGLSKTTYLVVHKCLGGIEILLNVSTHVWKDHKFALLQNMCLHSQAWIFVIQYFREKDVTHKRKMITTSCLQFLNGSFPIKKILVLHVLCSYLSHGTKHSLYYIGIERRVRTFNLIVCFIWGSKRWKI